MLVTVTCDWLLFYNQHLNLWRLENIWCYFRWLITIYENNNKTFQKSFGLRSFCYCAPKQWNSLPSNIWHIQSSHAFRTVLKSCLYKQQYHNICIFCLASTPILTHYPFYSFCAPVCVCRWRGGNGVVQGIEYIYLLVLRFYVCIFFDLVKCSMLTLVGEICPAQ